MSEAEVIATSLKLSSVCLSDARLLLGAGSRNAAYLLEQALEQLIRALATSEGLHIERHDAHQLDKTVRRFPAESPLLAPLEQLVWLEAYATGFRYATPTGRLPTAPDPGRLATAVDDLQLLLDQAMKHFGVSETEISARTKAPMRSPA